MREALGIHILIEFYECDPETLKSVGYIEKTFLKAADEAGAKVVTSNFHQFQPYGVSGVVVIEESHFTIHTWPEHNYAAVDLFYCDPSVDGDKAIKVIKDALKSKNFSTMELKRGTFVSYQDMVEKAETFSEKETA